jgi:hypothetical protein
MLLDALGRSGKGIGCLPGMRIGPCNPIMCSCWWGGGMGVSYGRWAIGALRYLFRVFIYIQWRSHSDLKQYSYVNITFSHQMYTFWAVLTISRSRFTCGDLERLTEKERNEAYRVISSIVQLPLEADNVGCWKMRAITGLDCHCFSLSLSVTLDASFTFGATKDVVFP